MTMFMAYVEVKELGEPDRELRIGPFHAEDPDASPHEQEETLRANLEEQGEIVNRIERVVT